MLWPNSKLETNFSLLSYLFRYLARTPSTPPPHRGMGLWATVKEPEPCIILIIANWISVGGEGGRGQRLMLASAQLADKYGICAHLVPSQTTKSWVLNFLLSKKPSLTPPPGRRLKYYLILHPPLSFEFCRFLFRIYKVMGARPY